MLLQQAHKKLKKEKLSNYFEWVKAIWTNSRGKPLDFIDRPYLVEIYNTQARHMVFTKSAQCFPPDTLITTQHGKVMIQDVSVGSSVYGSDGRMHKVVKKYTSEYIGKLVVVDVAYSSIVSATPEHPFLTSKENGEASFKPISDIEIFDNIYVQDVGGNNIPVKVLNKDYKEYSGFVYNLEVEEVNTYIANNYVVHNCGMSERSISEAVWICDQLGKNVLFVFPAAQQLADFVQARLDPVIESSDYLKDRTERLNTEDDGSDKEFGHNKLDKIGLKRIGRGFLYLRGATNEKQIISIDADCFDDKTEIYTENGWKFFKELLPDEKVATMNESGFLEYNVPDKYISYEYNGDLISVENERINFAVKPTHDLFVKLQRRDTFEKKKASDIYGYTHIEFKKNVDWSGERINKFVIPERKYSWYCGHGSKQLAEKTYNQKEYDANLFLEFLGWFIAEGSVSKQHSRHHNIVRISQRKEDGIKVITELLTNLGLEYKVYKNYNKNKLYGCSEIRMYNTHLAGWLAENVGVGCINKKIPNGILNLDKDHLYNLYKGLMLGDGTGFNKETNKCYYTTSKTLASQFEELVFKMGYAVTPRVKNPIPVKINPDITYNTENSMYVVSFYEKYITPSIRKVDWKKIPYNGFLYCVTVKNHTVYVRRNRNTTAHWSGQCVIGDERDRFKEANMPFLEKRLLASDLKWIREVSTPTLPGKGIHASYLKSDQRIWEIRCTACDTWQELDFFKHVDFEHKTVKCEKCKKVLNRKQNGRWRKLNPASKIVGFKINGLYNPNVTVSEFITKYQQAQEKGASALQQFYNQDLGLPYETEGHRLVRDDILRCVKDYYIPVHHSQDNLYAGVDVGVTYKHVVVLQKTGENTSKLIWAGTVKNFDGPFSSLEQIMNKFDIKKMVIDKKPETTKVREFIEKYPGRVYACTYPNNNFTIKDYYIYDDIEMELKADRTMSLDYLVSDIQNRNIELPTNIETVKDFLDQMTASVRITKKNEKTGREEAFWVEQGADHYFHTFNYARLATTKGIVGEALMNFYQKPQSYTGQGFVNWLKINAKPIIGG